MNSILSAISGNISKSLILSTFLPTVLFVILNVDVSRLNPYHFNVGRLKHGEGVTLTYRAVRLKD